MEEAKGYETLIICYHYCHGYCYSWLSMQGRGEEYEILRNSEAACDTITEILKGNNSTKCQKKNSSVPVHMLMNNTAITCKRSYTQCNLSSLYYATNNVIYCTVKLSSGGREGHNPTRWKFVMKKNGWIKQKQVQWQNRFGVILPCTLQLCTKHNVPLSRKFDTFAFTSQNTNTSHGTSLPP